MYRNQCVCHGVMIAAALPCIPAPLRWEPQVLLWHGLGTYGVLLVSWVAACAPFAVCDRYGWLATHRLQPAGDQSPALRRSAVRMAALNWAWLPLALGLASPLLAWAFPATKQSYSAVAIVSDAAATAAGAPRLFGCSRDPAGAARVVGRFVAKVCVCIVIDDLCFYTYHRLLHSNRWLYTWIHKSHHLFKAPWVWTSHAVHPVELLLQSIGAMLGPLLVGMTLGELWSWLAVRQWQGVLDHAGYELPLDPIGWLPGVGGTRFHDDHHRLLYGNYASCLSVIDDLFGTRCADG